MKEYLYNFYKKFMTMFGDIYLAFTPPACRIENVDALRECAEAGDVILRKYDKYADGLFIPGVYSHSGFVVSKNKVIHSIAEGVTEDYLGNFVIDTDGFCLVKPPYIDNECKLRAINRAYWHVDFNKTKYDFFFKPEGDEVYCHEFVADCLKYGYIEVTMSDKDFGIWPFRFNKQIYLADNIIDIGCKVYEFLPKKEET